MKAGPSLRSRLAAFVLIAMVAVLAGVLTVTYTLLARRVHRTFLDRTAATGRLVAGLVEHDPDDGVELEGGETGLRLLADGPEPTDVWITADGRTIVSPTPARASDSPPCTTAPPIERAEPHLSDGGPAARWCAAVAPRTEGVEQAPVTAVVTVVRDGSMAAGLLRDLSAALVLVAGLGTAAAVAASVVAVRRGLRPLREVGRALARVETPTDPFDLGPPPPAELVPMVEAFATTLERIRYLFDRERAFADALAHELRTPLAAVTTRIEVALARSEGAQPATATVLSEILEQVRSLGGIVQTVLEARRAQTAAGQGVRRVLSVAGATRQVVATFTTQAQARDQHIDTAFSDRTVAADPTRWSIIVSNLLANAVRHGEHGSTIVVRGPADGPLLVVENAVGKGRTEPGGGIGLRIAADLARCDGLRVVTGRSGDRFVARVHSGSA